MNDAALLWRYVEAWRSSTADVLALLRDLPAEDWDLPTDLPGWSVRAVAAHLAHLEAELAGLPQQSHPVDQADHIKNPLGRHTEAGVVGRRDREPEQIIEELQAATRIRSDQLEADPPTDPEAMPERTPGGLPWPWGRTLSNRALDMWMHEQDIRRAVGRPGHLDTLGAEHVGGQILTSFPYVVGKAAGAPPGSTVVLRVTGDQEAELGVEVGPDGRARPHPEIEGDPTVSLLMDFEVAVILFGGRRPVDSVEVGVTGDTALARAILEGMAVTP
jgi:uncharacterized protein (TIGR03083 family)